MSKRVHRKFKKGCSLVILLVLALIVVISIYIKKNNDNQKKLKEQYTQRQTIKDIKSHYNEYVVTNKEANIYNDKEEIIGKIGNQVTIVLDSIDITKDTKLLKLKEFEDAYIKYIDVDKTDNIVRDSRYTKYIPYNQNIITKDTTPVYDKNDKLIYQINKSYDLPIIVKEDNKYGVEFNSELLYIKAEDVEKKHDNQNTNLKNSNGVAVLNYHFFYDETNPDDKRTCNEVICMSKSQFKSELDYFKEINIFTVTMNELEMYMDGKIQLPKSVLITIDDGGRTKIAVDLLTEYKMNATIFLITSWFDPKTYYKTDYIELHSHSHNLHDGGKCQGYQGAEIRCGDKEKLLNDLKQSREALNGTTAFCYPFYEHNDYSKSILKEAGFTMAFIGEINVGYGYKLAEVGSDKLLIPRFVMFNYTTIQDLKSYFNEIK